MISDTWYRWGQANYRAVVVACGFACEAFMVFYLTLIANDVTRVCPSRSPHQVVCADVNCLICVPGYLNCAGLLKMHAAGGLAYELIRQLPSSDRQNIMNEGHGLFYYTDINWHHFHRDDTPGNSKNCVGVFIG